MESGGTKLQFPIVEPEQVVDRPGPFPYRIRCRDRPPDVFLRIPNSIRQLLAMRQPARQRRRERAPCSVGRCGIQVCTRKNLLLRLAVRPNTQKVVSLRQVAPGYDNSP